MQANAPNPPFIPEVPAAVLADGICRDPKMAQCAPFGADEGSCDVDAFRSRSTGFVGTTRRHNAPLWARFSAPTAARVKRAPFAAHPQDL